MSETTGSILPPTAERVGLQAIAVFEAFKGAIVLAAGLGILTLLGRDAHDIAERVVRTIHLNPRGHLSQVILQASERVNDARLWAAAAGTLVYTLVRWTEAWGLWFGREWAEWFALLSGALYLPWEIYELLERSTRIRWAVFLANLIIVGYMALIRIKAARVRVPH